LRLSEKQNQRGINMKRVEGEDIRYYDTPWGKEASCKNCGADLRWVECENCDEGFTGHDCGEDTCCCLDPLPNVVCDVCHGEMGWYVCDNCNTKKEEES
jgi:hypothetical protein